MFDRLSRFRKTFLRAIESRAPETRFDRQAFLRASGAIVPDPAEQLGQKELFLHRVCCDVLTAYRQLAASAGPDRAYRIVRDAYAEADFWPLWPIRLLLAVSSRPFAVMNRLGWAKQVTASVGRFLEVEEVRTPGVLEGRVVACGFNRFFVRHGEPRLTTVFCAADRRWMDLFDASSRPIRTERPTTLSTGGADCRFRFVEDPQKRAAASPSDVILEH